MKVEERHLIGVWQIAEQIQAYCHGIDRGCADLAAGLEVFL